MTRARPQIAMRTMVFLAQPPLTFQILSSVIAASRRRSPGRCLSAQALAGRRSFRFGATAIVSPAAHPLSQPCHNTRRAAIGGGRSLDGWTDLNGDGII